MSCCIIESEVILILICHSWRLGPSVWDDSAKKISGSGIVTSTAIGMRLLCHGLACWRYKCCSMQRTVEDGGGYGYYLVKQAMDMEI
jgi:hypothetical protein